MIKAKPTKNFIGVEIEGDFNDFYELVDAIYRMTGLDDNMGDIYWCVKNRIMAIAYDIRHAYQGDRNVKTIHNGTYDEMMKWHNMVLPKDNVYYSVEILFPEALFIAFAVQDFCTFTRMDYGKNEGGIGFKYSDFFKDRALLEMLSSAVLGAFAEVIGEDEFEKIMKLKERQDHFYYVKYLGQYLDKCNIELIKTSVDKRKTKIKNIAKRLIKKPEGYLSMEHELIEAASEVGCSVHELFDNTLKYPDEIEW